MDVRFLALGALLIAAGFLLEGPSAFAHMASHLVEDFTVELGIHLFIAGWVLLAYALYRLWRFRTTAGYRSSSRRSHASAAFQSV